MSDLGSMPTKKQKARYRMLYCQPSNVSPNEVGEVKMSAITLLNNTYSIDVDLFAEILHNWREEVTGTQSGVLA